MNIYDSLYIHSPATQCKRLCLPISNSDTSGKATNQISKACSKQALYISWHTRRPLRQWTHEKMWRWNTPHFLLAPFLNCSICSIIPYYPVIHFHTAIARYAYCPCAQCPMHLLPHMPIGQCAHFRSKMLSSTNKKLIYRLKSMLPPLASLCKIGRDNLD